MKHIKTLTGKTLKETMKKGGCGECQTSCLIINTSCSHQKSWYNVQKYKK
jgi:predicted ribosomally synthesized six-cysteine peptide SCIFF